jgi:D-glycero-D-manno-heptose 1,7-bisphosphate phosphatase
VQLVILDRDGIINVNPSTAITSEQEWRAIPGSLEAIARLSGAGYRVVVASNQPGLRRKILNIETLNSIHHKMQQELLEAGDITPVIDRRYKLSEVPQALRYQGEGHAQGKTVITV